MRHKLTQFLVSALVASTCLAAQATPPAAPSQSVKVGKPGLQNDSEYLKFTGTGDSKFWGPNPAFASVLAQTALSYPGITFSLPSYQNKPLCYIDLDGQRLIPGDPFEQLMIHAVAPSDQSNNFYVKLTAEFEKQLEKDILGTAGNLTPAAVLKMALNACAGNYPLAVLTAHNLFKEIAYQGRDWEKKVQGLQARGKPFPFPARYGELPSKLVNMRSTPGDKMGIWYHAFVPLTIAAWTDTPEAASNAIYDEYLARTAGSLLGMGSPNDPQKKSSDEHFDAADHQLFKQRNSKPSDKRPIVCNCSVTPESGPPGTKFTLKIKYQLPGLYSDAGSRLNMGMHAEVKEEVYVSNPLVSRGGSLSLLVRKESMTEVTRTVEREVSYIADNDPGKHSFLYTLSRDGYPSRGEQPFEVTAVSGGLIRTGPTIKKPQDDKYNTIDVGDGSINFWYHLGNDSVKQSLTFNPPPPTLRPGEKVIIKLNCPPALETSDKVKRGITARLYFQYPCPSWIDQLKFFEDIDAHDGKTSAEYIFSSRSPAPGPMPTLILVSGGPGGGTTELRWTYEIPPPKSPAKTPLSSPMPAD